MPPSPLEDTEGPVRVSVFSDGKPISEEVLLISVTVRRAVNKVPSATLVFLDGNMPEQTFPISDATTFSPGTKVTLEAGYGDNLTAIFGGIVVSQGLTIRGENEARLVVECRDEAVRLSIGRKNALYEDQTDSDIMSALIASHGLQTDVSATSVRYGSLVQHDCTDWDFLLARAQANGHLVLVEDGKVTVGPPQFNGTAVLTVTYGQSLIDFRADLDARHQYASVQAQAWDVKAQAIVHSKEMPPVTPTPQGNLDSATLAQVLGSAGIRLQTGAAWPKEALDSWAAAHQLKSGLSRLRGTMKFQGSALARVGALVELEGVGSRFSGSVYATGLTHRIGEGSWTTVVNFGAPVEWLNDQTNVPAPAAAGRVPGIGGLHVGIVVKLDEDPEAEHRIQVKVPTANIERVWARLLQSHASKAFGAFFVPEVGDEVVLGWFNDDPGFPVVLGSMYSSRRPPPYALAATNNTKAIVTRSQARLEFDDENKVITLSKPGGNRIVISDMGKSVVLSDQNGNHVELSADGIKLESSKDIQFKAAGKITLDAVRELSLSSKADVKVDGLNVNCHAQVGIVAKGSATAELSASGQTTVRGALVMIN